MKGLFCLAAFSLFFTSACGHNQIDLGAYTFHFAPKVPTRVHSDPSENQDIHALTPSEVVRVKDEQLYVNGKAYGNLTPGAVVDLSRGVLVDGALRSASALSAEDKRLLTLGEYYQGQIGELKVHVRPGLPREGLALADFGSRHGQTYVFGMTPITISHHGALWVNGIRYFKSRVEENPATLRDAESLEIRDARVVVDGQKWSPSIKALR